ncbi:fad synthetase 1 chloroplastic [Phtheirospermum japonicum]|uniref:FAD synthase n=1 Tax=Phtheirospermum japonicum TaxID=374723 RepID=A0A830BTP4_9LAMI|nr:fad synthetase 1 chloroplastic [Phtheirospermum japonicum]
MYITLNRAPIVAKCDRKRVLSSWAPLCGNITHKEFHVEFSKVRYLTPQQFVEKLSAELKISGVVAGENYRFGYRASGDSSDMVRLCKEYGMKASIVNSVMDKKSRQESKDDIDSKNSNEQGQVSSTRVRRALANGDMGYVSELLGPIFILQGGKVLLCFIYREPEDDQVGKVQLLTNYSTTPDEIRLKICTRPSIIESGSACAGQWRHGLRVGALGT